MYKHRPFVLTQMFCIYLQISLNRNEMLINYPTYTKRNALPKIAIMKFKYTELKETYLEVKKILEHASGDKII